MVLASFSVLIPCKNKKCGGLGRETSQPDDGGVGKKHKKKTSQHNSDLRGVKFITCTFPYVSLHALCTCSFLEGRKSVSTALRSASPANSQGKIASKAHKARFHHARSLWSTHSRLLLLTLFLSHLSSFVLSLSLSFSFHTLGLSSFQPPIIPSLLLIRPPSHHSLASSTLSNTKKHTHLTPSLHRTTNRHFFFLIASNKHV